jgi:hypothetical protein
MGEGVSSEEEHMDAWDLLGMLDLKRLLKASYFRGERSTRLKVLVRGF